MVIQGCLVSAILHILYPEAQDSSASDLQLDKHQERASVSYIFFSNWRHEACTHPYVLENEIFLKLIVKSSSVLSSFTSVGLHVYFIQTVNFGREKKETNCILNMKQ